MCLRDETICPNGSKFRCESRLYTYAEVGLVIPAIGCKRGQLSLYDFQKDRKNSSFCAGDEKAKVHQY